MPPSDDQYAAAFQNPSVVFNDPELRAATAAKNSWGAPNVITGACAAVCKMTGTSGRSWAVRCFKNKYDDQQVRYAAITAALKAMASPPTVGFEYLPNGILIGGTRYAILKMEWVAGESLIPYVQARRGKKSLRELADTFEAMAMRLSAAGIAHGDLQHGNVILEGKATRLIDYDGMYVPALKGRGSHESGHRNFQHPKRTPADFGPTIDNFSVWSIAVALHALSHDAGLWGRHDGGDERLLFCKADFENPDSSALFADLAKASNPQVRELARRFRSHLQASPLDFPAFETKVTPEKSKVTKRPAVLESWLPPVAPEWLATQRAPTPTLKPPASAATPAEREANLRDWLPEHLPTPLPPTGSEPPPDFAIVRHLLNEWEIAVCVWGDELDELRAGTGGVGRFKFRNSKGLEVGTWAAVVGATSAVALGYGLGLPIWAAGPCVAAIGFLQVSLAYCRYRVDAVHRVVSERHDATSSRLKLAETARIFAVVARKQFRTAAGQLDRERQRREDRFKVADAARRDLNYQPEEARRQIAEAHGCHCVATAEQQRLAALGLASRPALDSASARLAAASLEAEGAQRQFDTIAQERRRFQLLADQDQARIDRVRATFDSLSAIEERHREEFEGAEQQAQHPPARPSRELGAGLARLEHERLTAASEEARETRMLRERAGRFNTQFASDRRRLAPLALGDPAAATLLAALSNQHRNDESAAAAEMEVIYAVHREATSRIASETSRLHQQCAERSVVGLRALAEAVTTTRARHEAARRDATEGLEALACAERAAEQLPSSDRAQSAEFAADAAQSRLNSADAALRIAAADRATAGAYATHIGQEIRHSGWEVAVAEAAWLAAELHARAATDVVAEFDSATRELADFRNGGVEQIDATALKCLESSDAAELEHAELTAAAKQSVTSLSFRDYLRFGLTP